MHWRRAVVDIVRQYRSVTGRFPNLLFPRRYGEKMQWRKLFDLNPSFETLSDKGAVRALISERIGEAYLPDCLWLGERPHDIPFDRLIPPYFIKSTHGCAQIAYVTVPPDAGRRAELIGLAEDWLALNYGRKTHERGYVNVPARLIVERALMNFDGRPPLEIKAYVFHGRVETFLAIQVDGARSERLRCHLTRSWTLLPWRLRGESPMVQPPAIPRRLDEIIRVAEALAEGYDHLRVDMYDADAHLYVGEITVYSQSGFGVFTPDEADFILGSYWNLGFAPWRASRALIKGKAT